MKTKQVAYVIIIFLLMWSNCFSQGWFDNLKHSATKIYSETRREISRYGNEIRRDYARQTEKLSRNLRENYSEWENKIQEYGSSLNGTIRNFYENPDKLLKYERMIHKKVTRGTISAIKNIPVYDPESGRIVSFDEYSKNLVNNLTGGAGGDFANDPVAVTVGIMMDDDYLLKAKIIPLGGKYVSIEELGENGFSEKQINNIYSEYHDLKKQYENNEASFGKNFTNFTTKLTNLSKKESYIETISLSLGKLYKQIHSFYRHEIKIRNHDLVVILTYVTLFLMFLFVFRIIWKIITFPFRVFGGAKTPRKA